MVMSLLTEQQLQQVSQAINAAELKTDAELVTVLAAQSDNYHYIPTLWAAVIALLVPGILLFTDLWLETIDIFLAQLAVFVVLALIFRWPPLMMRLVPKQVRFWRASNLARRQFLEQNLHHTKGETGLLLFVSEAEHYVEIIADRGISAHIDDALWQAIIEDFVVKIKLGNTQQGFVDAIERCGELLAEKIPASGDNPNELSNHLVVL
jgi:putative membrane protein